MPITEVIQKDCIKYKLKLDQTEETVTAKRLLSLDPIQIELYEYIRLSTQPDLAFKKEEFLKKMKFMIIDYFEVQHMDVGMQLIANELGNGRQPPFFLLSNIIYFILKEPRVTSKDHIRKHWLICKKGHDILTDVLSFFGSSVYIHFWEDLYSGRSHRLTMHQRLQRGDEDDNDEEGGKMEEVVRLFEKHSNFWSFMETVLNSNNSLEERCELLMADFLVKFLKADLMERKDTTKSVRKSLFMKTLQKDTVDTYRKFDTCIDIVTKQLPYEDPQRLQVAETLLNMLITVSCYDEVINQNDLIAQMAAVYEKLDNDQCRQLLEMIKYPTFRIYMLDVVFSTANTINVNQEHLFYATMRHVPLHLEKLFEYILKTIPPTNRSIDDVYRHILNVSYYSINVLSTISIHSYRKTGEAPLALSDEQASYLRTRAPVIIEKWEKTMGDLIKQYTTANNNATKQKAKWAINITKLTLTNL